MIRGSGALDAILPAPFWQPGCRSREDRWPVGAGGRPWKEPKLGTSQLDVQKDGGWGVRCAGKRVVDVMHPGLWAAWGRKRSREREREREEGSGWESVYWLLITESNGSGDLWESRLVPDLVGTGWEGIYLEQPSVFVSPRTIRHERGSSWPRPKRDVVSGTLLQPLINSWAKYSNHRDFVKNEVTLGIISLGPSLHFSGQRMKVQRC